MNRIRFQNLIAVLASLFLAGCALISNYDQVAYEHATSAKVDTLALMDKATGSYDEHQKEVDALVVELNKAYEYDRGRSLNKFTVAQWDVLRDPNGDLVGGFLKMWKAKGSLLPGVVTEKKIQIGKAFDKIIALESGKQHQAESKG
jgi:outer membrane murein-binding lipoprotein Lpp